MALDNASAMESDVCASLSVARGAREEERRGWCVLMAEEEEGVNVSSNIVDSAAAGGNGNRSGLLVSRLTATGLNLIRI